MISLLWRTYRGTRWPFQQLDEKTIDLIISSILRNGRKISLGKKKQLSFYLAVFISRALTKQLILEEHLPKYTKQLIFNNRYLSIISDTIKTFFDIPNSEIEFIILIFYTFPECYGYFQKTDSTLNILKKYSTTSYESLINYVTFIERKHPSWNKSVPSSTYFWAILISGRIFVDIFGDIYFNSSDVRIFKHSNDQYPNLLPSIEKEIRTKQPNLSKNTLKSLTLRYTEAYVSEFSPLDFEPVIRILLLTDVALYIDLITKERLENLLRGKFNFILETEFATKKPDLVIATGLIEDDYIDLNIIYIIPHITKKDSENILKTCKEILQLKNKID